MGVLNSNALSVLGSALEDVGRTLAELIGQAIAHRLSKIDERLERIEDAVSKQTPSPYVDARGIYVLLSREVPSRSKYCDDQVSRWVEDGELPPHAVRAPGKNGRRLWLRTDIFKHLAEKQSV
jgi:hypothetical protein